MIMNVFEAVRDTVTARQAAEAFGIRVKQSGMARCPFHDDRNPSMKVDNRFHCFGCQADGDAIDFTARLFDLSKKDAAVKLADTFGIFYEESDHQARDHPPIRQVRPEQEIKEAEDHCYRVLCDYLHLLIRWKEEFAPRTPDEEWDDRFVEACHKIDYIEYVLDEIFLSGTVQERMEFIKENGKGVKELERRISRINAGREKCYCEDRERLQKPASDGRPRNRNADRSL